MTIFFVPNSKPIKTHRHPNRRPRTIQRKPFPLFLISIGNDTVVGRVTQEVQRTLTGSKTMRSEKSKAGCNTISGTHPSSLGLHPWCISTGRAADFNRDLWRSCLVNVYSTDSAGFTRVRQHFENFLLEAQVLVKPDYQKYGSGLKGYAKSRASYMNSSCSLARRSHRQRSN